MKDRKRAKERLVRYLLLRKNEKLKKKSSERKVYKKQKNHIKFKSKSKL